PGVTVTSIGGVCTPKAHGIIRSVNRPSAISACCQPRRPINPTASGENRNCPNEPAAVPTPKAKPRHSVGINLLKAASTRVNDVPAMPRPVRTPAERSSMPGVVEKDISTSPEQYSTAPIDSTRSEPKRSAMAPAKGVAAPQIRTWMASASANTSRPQLKADDIGVRKRPSAARGPKPIAPIRQPQMIMTSGVRHALTAIVFPAVDCTDIELLRPDDCAEHIGSFGTAKTKIRDRPHLRSVYAVCTTRYLRALWRSDACPSSDLSHSLLWLTGPCASSLAASFSVSTGSPQVGSSSPSPHARGR